MKMDSLAGRARAELKKDETAAEGPTLQRSHSTLPPELKSRAAERIPSRTPWNPPPTPPSSAAPPPSKHGVGHSDAIVAQRSWLASAGQALDANPKGHDPNAPPLAKLRRSAHSDESATFGSIRFPIRSMPAKFVHLAPDSNPQVVVSLLVDTWRIPSPAALLALNPPSRKPEGDEPHMMSTHLNLILRRGLAQAAHKTSAWVISCGERSNDGAHLAGQAMLYGNNLGYESPYIAVVATGRMHEDLEDIVNGGVHRYGVKRAESAENARHKADITRKRDAPIERAMLKRSSTQTICTGVSRAPTQQRKLLPRDKAFGKFDKKDQMGLGKIELDAHHSHFVIVDGQQEVANSLRGRIEYFISSQDVSGDGIQTPNSMVKEAPWRCPSSPPVAFSGRAWRLWGSSLLPE